MHWHLSIPIKVLWLSSLTRTKPIKPKRSNTDKTFYCTAFPVGTALASTWNEDLVKNVGKAIGNEVKEYGVDLQGKGFNFIDRYDEQSRWEFYIRTSTNTVTSSANPRFSCYPLVTGSIITRQNKTTGRTRTIQTTTAKILKDFSSFIGTNVYPYIFSNVETTVIYFPGGNFSI